MNAKPKLFASVLLLLFVACQARTPHTVQGYVEGDNIYVASPYSGALIELAVAKGQDVKKGEVLFVLDPNPQREALEQAAMALKQAEKSLNDLKGPRRPQEIEAIEAQIAQVDAAIQLGELRVKRNKKLYTTLSVDKDTLDASIALLEEKKQLKLQYLADLDLARQGSRSQQIEAQAAKVAELKDKVEEMQWMLDQKKGISPASGVIFETYFRKGEFVPAQQAVLSVLTPENVYIVFFVPAKVMSALHVGQAIEFTSADSDKPNMAQISYISPEAEYTPPLIYSRENYDKIVFRIEADVDHSLAFKPGQPVTVTLP